MSSTLPCNSRDRFITTTFIFYYKKPAAAYWQRGNEIKVQQNTNYSLLLWFGEYLVQSPTEIFPWGSLLLDVPKKRLGVQRKGLQAHKREKYVEIIKKIKRGQWDVVKRYKDGPTNLATISGSNHMVGRISVLVHYGQYNGRAILHLSVWVQNLLFG